jgi:hypothetical protein
MLASGHLSRYFCLHSGVKKRAGNSSSDSMLADLEVMKGDVQGLAQFMVCLQKPDAAVDDIDQLLPKMLELEVKLSPAAWKRALKALSLDHLKHLDWQGLVERTFDLSDERLGDESADFCKLLLEQLLQKLLRSSTDVLKIVCPPSHPSDVLITALRCLQYCAFCQYLPSTDYLNAACCVLLFVDASGTHVITCLLLTSTVLSCYLHVVSS